MLKAFRANVPEKAIIAVDEFMAGPACYSLARKRFSVRPKFNLFGDVTDSTTKYETILYKYTYIVYTKAQNR